MNELPDLPPKRVIREGDLSKEVKRAQKRRPPKGSPTTQITEGVPGAMIIVVLSMAVLIGAIVWFGYMVYLELMEDG